MFFKFFWFLRRNRIDILHVHLAGCFLFALTAAFIANVKLRIITWHNMYSYPQRKRVNLKFLPSLGSFLILQYAANISHQIIAVSNMVKEYNCDYYSIARDKVAVIYNGINSNYILNQDLILSNKKENHKYKIGVVGKLIYQKGHIYLVDAMLELIKMIPNIELLIIGDGPLREALNKKCSDLNLNEYVNFLGNRSDVKEQLLKLNLFIMPSLFEGFSIALLEAMSAKVPIIATNVGGNSEAISHMNEGILIEPKKSKSIVESVRYAYENNFAVEKMAENAYAKFKTNFTVDIMMAQLYDIYEIVWN